MVHGRVSVTHMAIARWATGAAWHLSASGPCPLVGCSAGRLLAEPGQGHSSAETRDVFWPLSAWPLSHSGPCPLVGCSAGRLLAEPTSWDAGNPAPLCSLLPTSGAPDDWTVEGARSTG